MKSIDQKVEDYNEAKQECGKYVNYNGDKRSSTYKLLSHRVIDLWMNRMNGLAKQLQLPNYQQTFNN